MNALESNAGFQGDLEAKLIRNGRTVSTRQLNATPFLAKLRLALRRAVR